MLMVISDARSKDTTGKESSDPGANPNSLCKNLTPEM